MISMTSRFPLLPPLSLILFLFSAQDCNRPSFGQTIPLSSCAVSECRFNQSTGSTTSVGVGVTSAFGVSASAQSTANFTTNSSAALIIDPGKGFDNTLQNSLSNPNRSLQSIGTSGSNIPVNIKITSDSIQSKQRDGSSDQTLSSDVQKYTANDFNDEASNKSNATFEATGFEASQDIRFLGTSLDTTGTEFKASVTPTPSSDSANKEYGTGNSSASAETRTRFQADITTSSFVNAFMSSF